jgi:transcription factor E
MQIPDELLNNLIKQLAGNDTLKLVEILKKRKDVSEFKIAEKLGISVNQVRNMIYRLQEYNLMSFIRKKDKTKGWYIYYWTLDKVKILNLIIDIKGKELIEFAKEISNIENTRCYICKPCRFKTSEDEALEAQFICNSCGEILEEQDALKRKRELIKKTKKNKEDLEIAKGIIDTYKNIQTKKKEKELVKEKEEKLKARRAAKKATKKVTKKATKKVTKKATKKVTKKATKKVTKKATKKVAKKATKKVTKKATKKVTKKATKKVAKKENKKKGILGRLLKK